MQRLSKIVIGVAVVAVIIGAGVAIGFFAGGPEKNIQLPPATNSEPAHVAAISTPVTHTSQNPIMPGALAAPPPSPTTPTTKAGGITNWEDKVEAILGAETDDTNKVQQLFELFPQVPDDAKPEIADHLSNLTSDAQYAPLGALLVDPALPDAALDRLMSDALNRPNSIKLPELLEVAKTPGHPKAAEAKDILALFLDQDFGNDWAKWQEKATAWLKDNPD